MFPSSTEILARSDVLVGIYVFHYESLLIRPDGTGDVLQYEGEIVHSSLHGSCREVSVCRQGGATLGQDTPEPSDSILVVRKTFGTASSCFTHGQVRGKDYFRVFNLYSGDLQCDNPSLREDLSLHYDRRPNYQQLLRVDSVLDSSVDGGALVPCKNQRFHAVNRVHGPSSRTRSYIVVQPLLRALYEHEMGCCLLLEWLSFGSVCVHLAAPGMWRPLPASLCYWRRACPASYSGTDVRPGGRATAWLEVALEVHLEEQIPLVVLDRFCGRRIQLQFCNIHNSSGLFPRCASLWLVKEWRDRDAGFFINGSGHDPRWDCGRLRCILPSMAQHNHTYKYLFHLQLHLKLVDTYCSGTLRMRPKSCYSLLPGCHVLSRVFLH